MPQSNDKAHIDDHVSRASEILEDLRRQRAGDLRIRNDEAEQRIAELQAQNGELRRGMGLLTQKIEELHTQRTEDENRVAELERKLEEQSLDIASIIPSIANDIRTDMRQFQAALNQKIERDQRSTTMARNGELARIAVIESQVADMVQASFVPRNGLLEPEFARRLVRRNSHVLVGEMFQGLADHFAQRATNSQRDD